MRLAEAIGNFHHFAHDDLNIFRVLVRPAHHPLGELAHHIRTFASLDIAGRARQAVGNSAQYQGIEFALGSDVMEHGRTGDAERRAEIPNRCAGIAVLCEEPLCHSQQALARFLALGDGTPAWPSLYGFRSFHGISPRRN